MSGFRVEGVGGNLVEVDTGNNVQAALTNTASLMGSVKLFSQVDSGDGSCLKPPETSTDYRMRSGIDTYLFVDYFNNTVQNTSLWKHTFSTMTMTEPGAGVLTCNANSTGTTATGCSLQTWRYFTLIPQAPLCIEIKLELTAAPVVNQIFEFGQFIATTTTAPADGIYWRYSTSGLYGVLNFNNSEILTAQLAASLSIGAPHTLRMIVDTRETAFFIDGLYVADFPTPVGYGAPYMTSALPICIQQRNGGTVTGSPQMQVNVGSVSVIMVDIHSAKPWPHILGGMGLHCSQAPNGQTIGQTAFYANNLAAGAGNLPSNTTNANFVGLGGQFSGTYTSSLAVNVDGIIASFLNPAGTINITPRTLYITGVWIHSAVTTVLVVATPLILLYALRYGSNGSNGTLAGSESASFTNNTVKIPRVVPIGTEVWASNAAVGILGATSPIIQYFDSPIVVSPGEYVEVSAKNMTTVLTSGVITHLIGFDGYWE